MARDWQQTQRHFGVSHHFDLRQNFRNTLMQALGRETILVGPNLGPRELAERFGALARHHYHDTFPIWSEELEAELRREWGDGFDDSLERILTGWNSQYPRPHEQQQQQPSRPRREHGVRL